MTINIPDGLPILSSGAHPAPHFGACFMEFTALLAGEPFNDHPRVVDLALRRLMQAINDSMSDQDRIQLVPLLGRAIGLVAPGWDGRRDVLMTQRVLASKAGEIFARKAKLDQIFARKVKLDPFGGDVYSIAFRCLHSASTEEKVDLATKAHEAYEEAMFQLGWEKPEVKVVGTETFIRHVRPVVHSVRINL